MRRDEHYETVTYWYGLQQPALVLTDELDVGNAESEKRHRYAVARCDARRKRWRAGMKWASITCRARKGEVQQKSCRSSAMMAGVRQAIPTLSYAFGRMRSALCCGGGSICSIRIKKRLFMSPMPTTEKPDWQEAGTWYTAGGNTVVFGDPRIIPDAKRKQHVELVPPAHVVQTSNRRWRDDEFLLPPRLTRGRDKIRVRCQFVPVNEPLFPGHPLQEEAWTEFRYWAYCFVTPGIGSGKSENIGINANRVQRCQRTAR